MQRPYGNDLRESLDRLEILPLIGVYDVFSATIAARHFDGLFISGFGFAASFYGLPDIGFNAWSDLAGFVQRVRTVLPDHAILVDIDDGFADVEVACHVVALLESCGASGVILEDQMRPRRCGHLNGKQILPIEDYLRKLDRVLRTRRNLFVVARTDATERAEILRRVQAFSQTDVDAVLVDGIGEGDLLSEIRSATRKPLAFNQIIGGASTGLSIDELQRAGVSLAIFSTPCLFAAQQAMEQTMRQLKAVGGLNGQCPGVTLGECNDVLNANLARRHQAGDLRPPPPESSPTAESEAR